MNWVRRHVFALALAFLSLFVVAAVAGGNLELKREQRRDIERQCETLRLASARSDERWFTLITYFENQARAAGRPTPRVLADMRRLIEESDPIVC